MSKVHGCVCGFLLFVLSSVAFARCSPPPSVNIYPQIPQALILATIGNHYPAISRALSTVGFQVREAPANDFESSLHERTSLLIVPGNEGQKLDAASVQIILRDVEGGTPLLVDGSNALTAALGVTPLSARNGLTRYDWPRYSPLDLRLPGRLTYTRFKVKPPAHFLADDPHANSPLVVSGSRGRGRFIYSAIPLEPQQGMVFQYLPFLAQAIVDELHVAPSLTANNLCVYIDFGGEPRTDPAVVVNQLKQWSVREVHLGAFYGSDMFLEYLPRFLAAAHQQGISVYAWLEYPMVSQEFWDAHPQWREVTANGHRAVMDWRLHMALEDPDCFKAVAELTRRLVMNYDWDGVDFAELYFEAERNIYKHPRDFTPMHPSFRRMFKDRYGIDPIRMFTASSPYYGPRNPQLRKDLEDFRVELITQLTQEFMETLKSCQAQKPYLRTTLTFIDALRDPTVTERYGVDPARLLALQQQYGFGVEIEDPYTVWNSTPDRYRAIGEYYRPRLQPGTPFTIDINVVDRFPPGRPLTRPSGLELYELLANVASHVDLVTLYAYSTFSADDMRLVPAVLAAQQINPESTEDGVVIAERPIEWNTDTRNRTVYLDGLPWPCRSDSQVLIPAGVHKVWTSPQSGGAELDSIHIENINGTILGAKQEGQGVTLNYESRGRCYVSLNRAPTAVLCDGAAGVGKVLVNGGTGVCLVLPEGKHTVRLQ